MDKYKSFIKRYLPIGLGIATIAGVCGGLMGGIIYAVMYAVLFGFIKLLGGA